ncbi:hypothetical protein AX16_002846 [Volvariella volvacea WC 439]|nr:hypothetical protein AX16_002846 [Volvariella volvacea WC 439]
MGNSPSARTHHDESVDYGYLTPQGVYTGPRDWNHNVVSQLIVARKLAPFYRPLEDYKESWDDDQILAARKELPPPEGGEQGARPETASIASSSTRSGHSKRPAAVREQFRPEAAIYRGAVECPICFLYYPSNINRSRCCNQEICTECFVQIKRNEPTATHLVSEPACCPYCVRDNFGVVYTPPNWRAGISSEGWPSLWIEHQRAAQSQSQQTPDATNNSSSHKSRQKSFSADSPEVVTIDQIRPGWEAKLAAVQAAVARRANRRIIMREVGGRLIPVGVTSGRVHALSPEEAAALENSEGGNGGGGSGSRRRRRNQGEWLGMGLEQSAADLEELMLMEAMRLSLLEHEEQQRKQAEEQKKQAAAQAAAELTTQSDTAGPGPSTLEARASNEASSTLSVSPSAPSFIPLRPRGSSTSSQTSRSASRSHTPISSSTPPVISGSTNSSTSDRHQKSAPQPTSSDSSQNQTTEHGGDGESQAEQSRGSGVPTIHVGHNDNEDPSSTESQQASNSSSTPSPSFNNVVEGEAPIAPQTGAANGDPALPSEFSKFERRFATNGSG